MYIILQNSRARTSIYTSTHHFGKAGKKNDCESLLSQEERLMTTFFCASLSISFLSAAVHADVAQPELRALRELVETLNVWVPQCSCWLLLPVPIFAARIYRRCERQFVVYAARLVVCLSVKPYGCNLSCILGFGSQRICFHHSAVLDFQKKQ